MSARERLGLYPAIEPYRQERLKVGGGTRSTSRSAATRSGKPALIVHGGPGGGCNSTMRRYHDPARYRIVLFDQRGCGRSLPHASLEANTTWHLVADMERLRTHLGIERWQLFGGSWGSTLSLAYAQTHPDRVTRPGPARHLPAAARGARLVLPGRLQLDVPRGVRGVPQGHPARGARRHDRRLLPPPHPSRPRRADRRRQGLVGVGGQHAVAGAGPRARAGCSAPTTTPSPSPASSATTSSTAASSSATTSCCAASSASAICPARSCTAATTS